MAPPDSHGPHSTARMHKRRPVSSRPCEWPTIRWKRNNNFIGRKNRLRRTISTSLKQQLLPERGRLRRRGHDACVLAGDGLGSLTAEGQPMSSRFTSQWMSSKRRKVLCRIKRDPEGVPQGRRRGGRAQRSTRSQCERERDTDAFIAFIRRIIHDEARSYISSKTTCH